MDERRTLSLLAWIMGSLLAASLVLSAIALAQTAPAEANGYLHGLGQSFQDSNHNRSIA
jgi:hypothetical protein